MLCLVAEKNVRERQPTNYGYQPSIETGFSCSLAGHLANSSNSILNFYIQYCVLLLFLSWVSWQPNGGFGFGCFIWCNDGFRCWDSSFLGFFFFSKFIGIWVVSLILV